MSDFHQADPITTLHKLTSLNPEETNEKLSPFTRKYPLALVLPSLISELDGAALPRILEALQSVTYLSQIVVTLGPASPNEFRRARDFFGRLPQPTVLVWNSGPRLTRLYQRLEEAGLSAGPDGKGRSVWMALGYLLADGNTEAIALHDCDIVTYDRELLDRLVFPVVNPDMGYQFCKGYYARFSDRLHGRVTRLFVTPLIRALRKMAGDLPVLAYLDAFRYPLAGEFCLTDDVAWRLRFPADWGLEIGILAEIYRNSTPQRICQSELCDRYDHKHQSLSDSPDKGLFKMAADIATTLYHIVASEGVSLSPAFFDTLRETYLHQAHRAAGQYQDEAFINGLGYDWHEELRHVKTFGEAVIKAGKDFLERPDETSAIPSWRRVDAALPSFLSELREAVEADNA